MRDYIKEMNEIANFSEYGDIEIEHMNADELLIDFLSENGFNELAEAYAKVHKWYA